MCVDAKKVICLEIGINYAHAALFRNSCSFDNHAHRPRYGHGTEALALGRGTVSQVALPFRHRVLLVKSIGNNRQS